MQFDIFQIQYVYFLTAHSDAAGSVLLQNGASEIVSLAPEEGPCKPIMSEQPQQGGVGKDKVLNTEVLNGIPSDKEFIPTADTKIESIQTPFDNNGQTASTPHKGSSMKLFVNTTTGKTILVEVESNSSIGIVKKKIENEGGITLSGQRLVFNGQVLESGRTLVYYNIHTDATLYLELEPWKIQPSITIDHEGKTITPELETSDTIEDVKQKIQDLEGIPADEQRLFLIYIEHELENHRTLRDYNIEDNSILHLVLRRGAIGMVQQAKSMKHRSNSINRRFSGEEREDGSTVTGDWNVESETKKQDVSDFAGGIEIFVKIIRTGKTIRFEVNRTETLENLKRKIHDMEPGIACDQHCFIFSGKKLEGGRTLREYNIQRGSTLHLTRILQGEIQIFVKTQSGQVINSKVAANHSIAEVKLEIQERLGIPPDQQRLVMAGRDLEDSRTLGEYNITNGTTLDFAVREVRGGYIAVETITGEKVTLVEVEPNDSVKTLKAKIQEKKGIPSGQQRLMFNGKEMNDANILNNYSIQNGSTIQLLERDHEGMEVFVKRSKGKTLRLQVEPKDTIKSVKTKIQVKTGISPEQQHLKFADEELLDGLTLEKYNIDKGSTLDLAYDTSMVITVKTPTGRNIALEVKPSDSVEEVKKKVCEKEGIPAHQQRLHFSHHYELEDGRTLSDYGIQNGATLWLKTVENSCDGVKIFMNTLKGKPISVVVEPTNTVRKVKRKIQENEGIPIHQQRLTLDGLPLEDSKTIQAYIHKHGSVFSVVLERHGLTQVSVTTEAGKTITLDVDFNDPIRSVKTKIYEKEGIPIAEQRLSVAGKELEDGSTLSDYNIDSVSKICLRRRRNRNNCSSN